MERLASDCFKEHDNVIASQLASLHGQKALLHCWEIPDPTYFSLATLSPQNVYSPSDSYVDPSRSGGVHSLIRAFLSETTDQDVRELASIPIQKDFLFLPTIEKKYIGSSRLVVMSTFHERTSRLRRSHLFQRLFGGPSSAASPFPDLIPAPHPVHWFSTHKYQPSLPDIWRRGKVGLVVLPKSTFVVRREISPLALEALVSSIRDNGMVPIACVYPDQHSLMIYHSVLRIASYFDDIVVAGPVTSLFQMVKLLTYIDASSQVFVPECDHDVVGPLSMAAILAIYRGKYASITKQDIHVFVNASIRAKKILQRYPGPDVISRVKEISDALISSESAQGQYDTLRRFHVLDILPDPSLSAVNSSSFTPRDLPC